MSQREKMARGLYPLTVSFALWYKSVVCSSLPHISTWISFHFETVFVIITPVIIVADHFYNITGVPYACLFLQGVCFDLPQHSRASRSSRIVRIGLATIIKCGVHRHLIVGYLPFDGIILECSFVARGQHSVSILRADYAGMALRVSEQRRRELTTIHLRLCMSPYLYMIMYGRLFLTGVVEY